MFNALIDYFSPNPELITFEPIFIPNLAKFSSMLPPVCAFFFSLVSVFSYYSFSYSLCC